MGGLISKPKTKELVEPTGKDVDEPRKDVSNTQNGHNQQEMSSPGNPKNTTSQVNSTPETPSVSPNHVSEHVQGSVVFSLFSFFFFLLLYI